MEKDPDNEYLTRAPTKRMEAEIVRDAVLFVAGNLDLGMGGPDIDYEMGFQVPRRSLYFRHAAEKEMTFLKIFDAAAVTECYQRKSSVMPPTGTSDDQQRTDDHSSSSFGSLLERGTVIRSCRFRQSHV